MIKKFLKMIIKMGIKAILEAIWGYVGALIIVFTLGKTFEFIERRSNKSK